MKIRIFVSHEEYELAKRDAERMRELTPGKWTVWDSLRAAFTEGMACMAERHHESISEDYETTLRVSDRRFGKKDK